jgi:hypothetical protein
MALRARFCSSGARGGLLIENAIDFSGLGGNGICALAETASAPPKTTINHRCTAAPDDFHCSKPSERAPKYSRADLGHSKTAASVAHHTVNRVFPA